eukprot:1147564-Pelagomonas_calceolata.AAC.5
MSGGKGVFVQGCHEGSIWINLGFEVLQRVVLKRVSTLHGSSVSNFESSYHWHLVNAHTYTTTRVNYYSCGSHG